VAANADWPARGAGGQGSGLGIGFARYKNMAAYAAVVVALTVDKEVRLDRIWLAADAGLVINPDGARNQLEGGAVQGASWTLKEQVRMAGMGITSRDWESYPILRFSEIPEIEAVLIEAPEEPSLGVGECSLGPTAAAIGNAVAHALGARIYDMPLSRERIMATLLGNTPHRSG
jgi:CO/xanthine dehydrogenase Mo-binding subunit